MRNFLELNIELDNEKMEYLYDMFELIGNEETYEYLEEVVREAIVRKCDEIEDE